MILWLCILVRIVSNPFSNVFQKLLTRQHADPLFIICTVHGLLSLACIPIFLFELPPLPTEFWLIMSLCTLFTVSGNVLIVQAVKRSDLSVLGPINAWKSVVSLVPGFIFLGEVPEPMGLVGIAMIVAGSYFLVDRDPNRPAANAFLRFFSDRGIQYRFAALILSAIEAVVLKKALLVSSPLAAFAIWSLLGFALSAVAVLVLLGRAEAVREAGILRSHGGIYLLLFATTGLMQLTTIVILAGFQVGYALALFQTSTLISVLLGWHVFREPNVVKRMFGSLVMAGGAALIVVSRSA